MAPSPAGLEPDAIGVAQDTVIGMANVGPTVSVGFTLAALSAEYRVGSFVGLGIVMVAASAWYTRTTLRRAKVGVMAQCRLAVMVRR